MHLASEETRNQVQQVLASHLNGERTMKHPHFLKSSVFCGQCGSRMIVSNEKKKNGVIYPYFVCGGRHSKRCPDCEMKAVLIDVVEKKIEQIYDSISLSLEGRKEVEITMTEFIKGEKMKYETELEGLQREKTKLEHKRKKLLEAHYSDAIPLDLLKSEQKDIAKKLAVIDHDIKMHNATFKGMLNNLRAALDIVEDCRVTYRKASPYIKRLLNQAIFAKFNLYGDDDLEAEPQLISPFQEILSVADKKEQKNLTRPSQILLI